MTIQGSFVEKNRPYVACRPIVIGIGIALTIAMTPVAARASTYRVYTDHANATMTLNAGDGFCSLAEAVQHARGNTIYNCTDFDPSSGVQRIELIAAPNRPFSTNHWTVTSPLTLNRQGVQIRIFGSGAFIDSTTYSAFIVPSGAIAFFERVTLTNTNGSGGGRLIENYGNLSIYGVTITKGDVTGSQHATGRGGGIFNGNTGVISFAENSTITANKARKGGGVYNDSGIINELGVNITNNTATQAGGGIYNISTSPGPELPTNGTIVTPGLNLSGNSAPAGGGAFNRGLLELLTGSSVSGNFTTTGSSNEACTGSANCDGSGGGILSAHLTNGAVTRLGIDGSFVTNNTAIARGGAIYNVGVLELAGNAINGNRAADGAFLWVTGPTDGAQQYCNVYGSDSVGPATINNNCTPASGSCSDSTSNYSIVSGIANANFGLCHFKVLPTPGLTTTMTATGNRSAYCKPGMFLVDSNVGSRCPQP